MENQRKVKLIPVILFLSILSISVTYGEREAVSTADMNKILKKADNLLKINPLKAISLYKDVLSVKNEKLSKEIKLKIFSSMGKAFFYMRDGENAIKYLKQAVNLAKETGNSKSEIINLRNIGSVLSVRGKYGKALEYYNQSLLLSVKRDEPLEKAKVLNNIGLAFIYMGDFKTASEKIFEALKILENTDKKNLSAMALNNLGLCFQELKKYDEALNYYKKSLYIKKNSNDKKSIANAYNNIGQIYSLKGNYEKALDFLEKALDMRTKQNDIPRIAESYTNIGVVFSKTGKNKKAIDYLRKSITLKKKLKDPWQLSYTYNVIANVYFNIRMFKEAIRFSNISLNIAKKLNSGKLISENLLLKSSILESEGNFRKALKTFKSYSREHEKYLQYQNNGKIDELKIRYDTEKKDKLIKLLEKDNEISKIALSHQKNLRKLFFLLSLLMFFIILLVYFAYRIKTRMNRQLVVLNKQLKDKSTKLENAINEVNNLSGLLPICSSCKKIRDDNGYWKQVEVYIDEHSDASFTHSLCPECQKKLSEK